MVAQRTGGMMSQGNHTSSGEGRQIDYCNGIVFLDSVAQGIAEDQAPFGIISAIPARRGVQCTAMADQT